MDKDSEKQQEAPENSAAENGAPDYQAMYEQAKNDVEKWKSNARKWEERAHENGKKLDEQDKTAEQRISELAGELEKMKAEKAHDEMISSVADEIGVPAALLKGDSEDEVREYGQKLKAFVESQTPKTPNDMGGAASGGQKMTRETIAEIKDPRKRREAIAQNIELFE